jgi:nucleoside 2-deoxyribosyltransferase
MNCYIAAALFTPAQIRVNARIAAIARDVGLSPFLPSVMSAEIWKGRAPKDCEPWERRAVVEGNIVGMLSSPIMIARVSGDAKEVDTGVAWEMGYFCAIGRFESSMVDVAREMDVERPDVSPRTLIAYIEPSDRGQHLNLMLAETVSAAAYGDAQLHALLQAIRGAYNAPEGLRARQLARNLAEYAPDKLILHEREPIGTAETTIVKPRRTPPPMTETADAAPRDYE